MSVRGLAHTVAYLAWDTSANTPKTGDVANHTLRVIKDGTSSAPTNSPSEVDATNAPGVYKITLTATECTADGLVLCGKSSTANVAISPLVLTFESFPTNFSTLAIESSTGRVDVGKILGTASVGQAGYVAPDWGHVYAPTTTNNLSGTTVAAVSGAVGSVTGNVGGNVVGSVGSVAGGVTVTTVSDKTGYSLSSGGVQAIWDALTSALTTSGSIGKWILDKLDVVLSTRLAPTVSGRTLDVSAAGNAGIDLGNIDNPTATNNLSGTTVAGVSGSVTVADQYTVDIEACVNSTSGDELRVTAIVKKNGLSHTPPTGSTCYFEVHEFSSETLVYRLPSSGTVSFSAAKKCFEYTKTSPGLSVDQLYYITAYVVMSGTTYTAKVAIPTIGGA